MDPIKNRRAERQDLVTEIVEGRRRLHELPENLSPEECAAIRREALERLKGASMEHSGSFTLDAQRAASRHCENFLGAARIPLGVTGPLTILGEYVSPDEEIYVPLATTEGALVASANRGCSAVRAAGGAVVRVEDVGMTRAPVFRSSGIEETQRFLGWVRDHEDDIRTVTEGTSRHLKLVDIRTQTFGTSIYVRFRFKLRPFSQSNTPILPLTPRRRRPVGVSAQRQPSPPHEPPTFLSLGGVTRAAPRAAVRRTAGCDRGSPRTTSVARPPRPSGRLRTPSASPLWLRS